jgi:1,4-alpha-glucan branching enzyme
MGHLVHTLTNRRYQEKTIAYVESHDQAIVGDKTTLMWLMNEMIYTDMSLLKDSAVADRAVALHKMIRLLTFCLGGEGYLNFMGNEFGHPEWVDFPRDGNGWSYNWCRRQWSLADSEHLRYKGLMEFDKAMQSLEKRYGILGAEDQYIFETHENDKIIVFEKGGNLFIFNFHPNHSFVDRVVPTRLDCDLQMVLDSDELLFGGHGFIDHDHVIHPVNGSVRVYIPCRTVLVYSPVTK